MIPCGGAFWAEGRVKCKDLEAGHFQPNEDICRRALHGDRARKGQMEGDAFREATQSQRKEGEEEQWQGLGREQHGLTFALGG